MTFISAYFKQIFANNIAWKGSVEVFCIFYYNFEILYHINNVSRYQNTENVPISVLKYNLKLQDRISWETSMEKCTEVER